MGFDITSSWGLGCFCLDMYLLHIFWGEAALSLNPELLGLLIGVIRSILRRGQQQW